MSDFILAAANGYLEVVKLLLSDPKVDPTEDNNLAICWASGEGHLEVVKLLLTCPKVNPAVRDNYSIRWAVYHGHFELVKLLLADSRVSISKEVSVVGCTVAQLEELLDE